MSEEPRKKALIVAISEYNDKQLAPLEFCKNDGEEMHELLKSLGYEISENHKLIGYVKFDRMREMQYMTSLTIERPRLTIPYFSIIPGTAYTQVLVTFLHHQK